MRMGKINIYYNKTGICNILNKFIEEKNLSFWEKICLEVCFFFAKSLLIFNYFF